MNSPTKKVNLPAYIDINMVQELMRLTGRNKKSIINELMALYQEIKELGMRRLSDSEIHVYVNKYNNVLELCFFTEEAFSVYSKIIKDDIHFELSPR